MTDSKEEMVENLIQSDTLIGLEQYAIKELPGEPEAKENSSFQYLIREKYEWDIDPVYISYLVIEFDSTGKAIRCTIKKN